MDNILKNKIYSSTLGMKIKEKVPRLPEWTYFFALFMYLLSQFAQGTLAIKRLIPMFLPYWVQMFVALIIVLKIVTFDEYYLKDWFILLFLGIVLWQSGINAGELNLFYYYIAIIGAKNIDFKKILRFFLVMISSLLILTFIITKLKIIPGLVFNRGDGALRYALGTVYPSDLSARCFYLMITYALLRDYKLKLPEYIGLISITIWAYVVTDTKVDLILMVFFLLIAVFYKQTITLLKKITSIGIAIILGSAVSFMILMTYFYNPSNHLMKLVDHALSGRFYFSHIAFEKYNVTFLGQYIPQNGFGGNTKTVFDYFYIDCSYIRILMMLGAFVFLLVVGYLLYLSHMFISKKYYSLEITLILIAISSLIDQHMWEISYNIIFLATFANLNSFKHSSKSLSI